MKVTNNTEWTVDLSSEERRVLIQILDSYRMYTTAPNNSNALYAFAGLLIEHLEGRT